MMRAPRSRSGRTRSSTLGRAGPVGLVTSAQLTRLPTGYEVAVAGLVIARQRPGTANGTMFLLFEDEFGTVNLIVSKSVYERHRHLARAEPLLLAKGRLERSLEPTTPSAWALRRSAGEARADGDEEEVRPVINLIVRELAPLERFLPGGVDDAQVATARVHHLPGLERARAAHEAAAVAEEELEGSEVGSSIRAVAPPVQSFASGRRR